MIRANIGSKFPHHTFSTFNLDFFIADYTELTRTISPRRSVEIFSPSPCLDNSCFSVKNPNSLLVDTVIFDNNSFKYSSGNAKSQCETASFPSVSDTTTWILFVELKYSLNPLNNANNLRKAIKQLFKTRYHYIQSSVFSKNENNCYLIGALPLQSEPFSNFSLTPSYLVNLKMKHNIILRLKNSIEIENESLILV